MILKLVQIVSNVFVVAVVLAAGFLLIRIACAVFMFVLEGYENFRELRKRQQLDAEADTPPEPSPPSWQVVIDDPEADVKKEVTADNSAVNELLTRILQQRVADGFDDEPDADLPHFVEAKPPESPESPEVDATLRTFRGVPREGVPFDFGSKAFIDLAIQPADPVAASPDEIDGVPPSSSESPELRAALDTPVNARTDADVVGIVGPDEDGYRPIKASRSPSSVADHGHAVASRARLNARLELAGELEAKYGGIQKVLCEGGGGFDRSREDHWLLLQRFARQLRD